MTAADNDRERVAELEAELVEVRSERDELRRFLVLARGSAQAVLDGVENLAKAR